MSSFLIIWRTSSGDVCSSCARAITTFSTLTGLPPSYLTVTWLLPSGRTKGIDPVSRDSSRALVKACASVIGSGINSGVSSHANPNIIP